MSEPAVTAAAAAVTAAGRLDGEELLAAQHLHVSYPAGRRARLVAVEDVSLSLAAGEMLGIVGESGSGKTTVARCLVGLQSPDSGAVTVAGQPAAEHRSADLRRTVQLVFQDPFASLNPRLRIGTMLRQLLAAHHLAHGEAATARSVELMELVGLPPAALSSYPSAFSGGQRQRVAIARALAVSPSVLVADEPISALDVSVQATILALFADLRDRLGLGVVMISHNLAAVRHVCDRVAVMYLGRIVEQGRRDEIFSDPRHPYTAALLAAAPRVRPSAERVSARIAGEPPSPGARPGGCAFHPRCPRAEPRCSMERPELLVISDSDTHAVACHFREEHRR